MRRVVDHTTSQPLEEIEEQRRNEDVMLVWM